MSSKHEIVMPVDAPCSECGFGLYYPIGELNISHLGIYNDARFPGRCILSLNMHADHVEDLSDDDYVDFMHDIRNCVRIMKRVLVTDRINIAILGNTESHVHAHLIPRYPDTEPIPDKSPWNDSRAIYKMSDDVLDNIRSELAQEIRADVE